MWNLNIKINKTETDLIQRTDGWLPGGRRIVGLGEKVEGIKNYKLAVTEQLQQCKL